MHFMKRKRRLCNVAPIAGAKYCGEHVSFYEVIANSTVGTLLTCYRVKKCLIFQISELLQGQFMLIVILPLEFIIIIYS
jgi:hypothetical protein